MQRLRGKNSSAWLRVSREANGLKENEPREGSRRREQREVTSEGLQRSWGNAAPSWNKWGRKGQESERDLPKATSKFKPL